jgi:ATP-binding cassette subfamily F protein uup
MHYLSAEKLSKVFAEKPIFTDLTFHISKGDKICLVAANGSGKTTLLKILAGKETAESGKVWVHKDVRLSFLDQDPELEDNKTVLENIFSHNHPVVQAVKEYERLAEDGTDADALQHAMGKMDELNAWNFESLVHQVLNKLNIHRLEQPVAKLSGGQRKRLALAKVLIDLSFFEQHTLLVLDEPTNHLDFEMIDWLSHFLSGENITLLMVSHDRYFLDEVCNEVWELENGSLYFHKGDYGYYLVKKAEREIAENASVEKAQNRYRKELEWMRRQPKARTTKSKSRIDAFYEVEEKAHSGKKHEQLQLQVKMTRLGGKILEFKKVYKSFGERVILKGFDYTFKRGERIGIIGKNGTGKTTFLNMIMGVENADSGKINQGETVVFGYFSQAGIQLKEDQRVIEFVKNIAEHFPLANGTKVMAGQFLQRFLFTPEQQFSFISKLSGGERKRLQLLSVLYQNPNFLILDEPTNDLDLVTLQVLEEFLQNYEGCLLLVSHDRYFMDKLVDHLFVFEGNGVINDFPGNYTQFRNEVLANTKQNKVENKPEFLSETNKIAEAPTAKRKLTFKEKSEFEKLEKELPLLEKRKVEINNKITAGSLAYEQLQPLLDELANITAELETKELRWLELSELV